LGALLFILATFAWAGWANFEFRKQAADRLMAQMAKGELVADAAGDDAKYVSPLTGKVAPAFELEDLSGKKVSLASYKGKAVLVNFWATWCAPCEDEFPELQAIYRSYRQRPFGVVMVSTNDPEDKEGVLKFLNEQHAITKNYLSNVPDPIDLVAAFGADFNGGVPFTVLLGPDGRVLYEKLGEIDPLEIRRIILKNLPDDPQHSGIHAYWNSSF
jgi:thiol-disulfide isomerase/thioredoxin